MAHAIEPKVRLIIAYAMNGFLLAWMPHMAAANNSKVLVPYHARFIGATCAVVAIASVVTVVIRESWKWRLAALISMALPVLLLVDILNQRLRL